MAVVHCCRLDWGPAGSKHFGRGGRPIEWSHSLFRQCILRKSTTMCLAPEDSKATYLPAFLARKKATDTFSDPNLSAIAVAYNIASRSKSCSFRHFALSRVSKISHYATVGNKQRAGGGADSAIPPATASMDLWSQDHSDARHGMGFCSELRTSARVAYRKVSISVSEPARLAKRLRIARARRSVLGACSDVEGLRRQMAKSGKQV